MVWAPPVYGKDQKRHTTGNVRWLPAAVAGREQQPRGQAMDRPLSFGDWLKHERKPRLGLSQKGLGKQVGYSERMIRAIEAGKQVFAKDQADRLAELFEVPSERHEVFTNWAQGLAPLDWDPGEGGLGCTGEACNGQDPGTTNCSERVGTAEMAEIEDEHGEAVGWVQLRWSERCQTNWARAENNTGRPNLLVRVYLRDAAGDVIEETAQESRAKGIYGWMWHAPTGEVAVRACAVIEGYDEVCTNPH